MCGLGWVPHGSLGPVPQGQGLLGWVPEGHCRAQLWGHTGSLESQARSAGIQKPRVAPGQDQPGDGSDHSDHRDSAHSEGSPALT